MPSPRTPIVGPLVCVLLGFAALGFLVLQAPQGSTSLLPVGQGYQIKARFENVGDLKVGSPLTISGVRVGAVDQILYDPASAKALITLRVTSQTIRLPVDSIASVRSLSPVGGKQVVISPGGSGQYLVEGSEILQTRSVLGLETLIEKSMNAAVAHTRKTN